MGDLTVHYDNGSPMPTTEDTVQPDKKVYVKLSEVAADVLANGTSLGGNAALEGTLADLMDDDEYFKFSYKKGSDNSKMILGISLVEKKLGGGSRDKYIEIKLADDYTDDEYKINPTFIFTAKDNIYYNAGAPYDWKTEDYLVDRYGSMAAANAAGYNNSYDFYYIEDGDKFEGEFTLWISNTENEADEDYAAGTGGVTLKPTKNDDNEIVWYDENDDIAMLTFEGDSSVDNFFPKLSTKWDNSTYATYFADQDAFIFDFISNPDISSTSRPVLTIYDPYYDYEEDESLVDSENVVIYKVVDGELVDVTADWSYGETDDGEMAYTTKTRQLGTYIFCEVAVAGSEEVVEEPVDDGKVIPNTGR